MGEEETAAVIEAVERLAAENRDPAGDVAERESAASYRRRP
jgi:hypothetical protein